MVRRVEPRLVCVWVAVNRASSLLVSVFEGRQVAGTGPDVFTDGQPKARGAANTLRIGEQLHVGVAVAEIPEAELPLTPGVNYSYNLALGSFVVRGDELTSNGAVLKAAEVTPSADLKSERLLEDGTLAGHAHLALGYEPGELPGFALRPAQLTDLRILHGSCRRPGFVYRKGQGEQTYDGLAWVDDLIKDWRRGAAATPFDPNARPHQLFLTGDQIYADDVAGPLLPMLNRLGNQMVSRVERLPMRYPPDEDDKSKEAYLDAPLQKGFPTLAAFFDRMESEDKDPLEELKSDRRVRVLADPSLRPQVRGALRARLRRRRVRRVDPGSRRPARVAGGPPALPGRAPAARDGVRDQAHQQRPAQPPDLIRASSARCTWRPCATRPGR